MSPLPAAARWRPTAGRGSDVTRRGSGALVLLLAAATAAAHPLGNNTVNRQAAIAVAPGRVSIDYRMDLAEIPTLAAEAAADADGDGEVTAAEWRTHARRWAREAAVALQLAADGEALRLRVDRVDHALRDGEAGLRILQLHARLQAALPARVERLAYRDDFRPREQGWKEVWMRGLAGVRLEGAAARTDRSHALTAYPPGTAPLDELHAEAVVRLPAPAVAAVSDARPPAGAPGAASRSGGEALQGTVRGEGRAREIPDDAGTTVAPPTPEATPRAPAPGSTAVPRADALPLFRLGIHHILVGFDHLAFLAGLLLLAPRFGPAVRVVTAFTLAHSVTLYLAASGHLVAPPAIVEPAIALTVAWIGALALCGKGGHHGPVLAFAFGLVHGLGFAGALAETLGEGRVTLLPLLAFNLGIEVCQIVLVAAALSTAAPMRRGRLVRFARPLRGAASLAVLGSGLVWFFARI
ncbi:MAG TPA: HupE/UreJ family protein [Ramlibacter sp.]